VETAVGALADGAVAVLGHLDDERLQGLDLLVGDGGRGQRRGLALEEPAGLDELEGTDVELGVGGVGGQRLGDIDARAVPRLHQTCSSSARSRSEGRRLPSA
jgi:hypothetical protein